MLNRLRPLAGLLAAFLPAVALAQDPTPTTATRVVRPPEAARAKFPGVAARPARTVKVEPRARLLDARHAQGLDRILRYGRLDLRDLPLYFDSVQDLGNTLYTAAVLAGPAEALRRPGIAAATRTKLLRWTQTAMERSGLAGVTVEQAERLLQEPALFHLQKLRRSTSLHAPFSIRSLSYATAIAPVLPHEANWRDRFVDFLTCEKPLVEGGWSAEVGSSFTWSWNIPYVCGVDFDWFDSSLVWCDYVIDFTVSFTLGCGVGFEVDCCGASAWGSCTASACLFECASCTGQVALAAGGLAVTPDGSACAYGLPVVVGISCQFAGITLFDASQNLSPYTVTGPCPPADACDH